MGKAKGQLHRLAMVLQAMRDASYLLVECGEDTKEEVSEQLLKVLPMTTPLGMDLESFQTADGNKVECPVRLVWLT